jgi:hypothetical protein
MDSPFQKALETLTVSSAKRLQLEPFEMAIDSITN